MNLLHWMRTKRVMVLAVSLVLAMALVSGCGGKGGKKEEATKEEIIEILAKFTGEIIQRPPVFSAIKINGQRAYKLARDGREVEMPERRVTIHSLELIDYAYPELKLRIHVSSGTYIRSLAIDIGEALGAGAYCSQLRRTQIANWSVLSAQSPEEAIANRAQA